ncbi:cytochrome b5-related protein-like isoform X2 [Periplaneta americana]|uniref:cytochrome b5-related protein-like isoform X2 n=1 Tax=Periplaneta americana TaxID=6978 RepID=UPI0037E76D2A
MEAKWTQVQRLLKDLFPRDEEKKSSLPGLGYPSLRDDPLKSSALWLKGKCQDDNADGLWRVHDDLYDLTGFIDKHPGGSYWLSVTKVRKVWSDNPPGTPWKSMAIADLLLMSSLASAVLAAFFSNFLLGLVSGVLLALTTVSAHNFFHQRDNFRMYYFDLSFMSSREWRVSHSMSHHLYTNTLLDLEISMLEPFLQLLPRTSKPWWVRYGSWLVSPLVYSFMFHTQLLTRIVLIVAGYPNTLKKENFLPLLVPALMLCSTCGVVTALLMWIWVTLVASFTFGFIGLNAAHHHPELFHDGDAPRPDRDWGLGQVDAVRDRPEISRSLFLVLVTFGDHCLHHLFPTVDHSHLHILYPVFYETCKQFNIDYQPTSVFDLIRGQFQQLANNTPNPNAPGTKTVLETANNTSNKGLQVIKTGVLGTADNTSNNDPQVIKTEVLGTANNTSNNDPQVINTGVLGTANNTTNNDPQVIKTGVLETANNTSNKDPQVIKTGVLETANNTSNKDPQVTKTGVLETANNTSNKDPQVTKTGVLGTANNTSNTDPSETEAAVPTIPNDIINSYPQELK